MDAVPLAQKTSRFVILRHRISRLVPQPVLQLVRKHYYAQRVGKVAENAEPDLVILKHFLQPGEVAVDVGANVGIYTKFLSHWVGMEGHVYSIEPIPMTFEILRWNIRKLCLNNVFAVNCAVSENSGFVTMKVPVWSSGAENFSRAAIVEEGSKDGLRSTRVAITTLDSLLAAASKPVSFIKLDVEGHELQCIKGACRIISNSRPAWLVETWGDPQDETDVAHTIFEFVKSHGYQPFWFDGRTLIRYHVGHHSMNFWFLTPQHLEKLRRGDVLVSQ